MDLIVNNKPDLPLKVSLERASLAASVRVEEMKKKNLSRFESVAHNLQNQAEHEKLEYARKFKQKKKTLKAVEDYVKNEKKLDDFNIE